MTAGCELMTWYVGEALRFSGVHRQPPRLRNAIKLHEWLKAKGKTEVTRSEIMQFGPAPLRQKAEADAALATLEEHGLMVRANDSKAAKWTVIQEATR
jgi:TPR repeat protein